MICDFAQYYHILDWRGLPLSLAATLASGLPEESRCRRRLSGQRLSLETTLLASIADGVALLLWRYCEEGTERPASILAALQGRAEAKPRNKVYRCGADFMREYQRFVKG